MKPQYLEAPVHHTPCSHANPTNPKHLCEPIFKVLPWILQLPLFRSCVCFVGLEGLPDISLL